MAFNLPDFLRLYKTYKPLREGVYRFKGEGLPHLHLVDTDLENIHPHLPEVAKRFCANNNWKQATAQLAGCLEYWSRNDWLELPGGHTVRKITAIRPFNEDQNFDVEYQYWRLNTLDDGSLFGQVSPFMDSMTLNADQVETLWPGALGKLNALRAMGESNPAQLATYLCIEPGSARPYSALVPGVELIEDF